MKSRRLPGGLGLGLRADALALGLVAGDPGGGGQPRGDRHADDGRRDQRHHAPMPPVGLALLQFVEADAEHPGDQLQPDILLAVLCGRASAAIGSLRVAVSCPSAPIL